MATTSRVQNKEETKYVVTPTNIHNQLPTFKFGLGWVVRDEITGFEGVVVYRCDNITGCNQYGVAPNKKKHGTETRHIDEGRLTFTGEIVRLPITAEEVKKSPGGIKNIPTTKALK